MTDNELLLAISNIMDKKLEPIHEQLDEHTRKFEILEQRFDARLDGIDERLDGIDERLDGIDERLDGIDERLDGIDARLDRMDTRMDTMDRRLKKVELCQENVILPRLQNIEECYLSTFERYKTGIAKIDAMQADIAVIKSVVSEHSEKLKKIS